MSNFKGEYLRILTPKTSDGTTIEYVDGQIQYTESHLPLTAKKHIEKENLDRAAHLKHIIEHVGGDVSYLPEPSKSKPEKRGPQPKVK